MSKNQRCPRSTGCCGLFDYLSFIRPVFRLQSRKRFLFMPRVPRGSLCALLLNAPPPPSGFLKKDLTGLAFMLGGPKESSPWALHLPCKLPQFCEGAPDFALATLTQNAIAKPCLKVKDIDNMAWTPTRNDQLQHQWQTLMRQNHTDWRK